MKKILLVVCVLCLLFSPGANLFGQEQDKLLQLLKQELDYNMQELKKQELSPYFISFRVIDKQKTGISSSFGVIASSLTHRARMFVPQIRLGSPAMDNFKLNPMGTNQTNGSALLPFEDDGEPAIREGIWRETLQRYRFAKDMYKQVESRMSVSVEEEDKSPCFSEASVEKYYEPSLPDEKQEIDLKIWEKRLHEISSVFKALPDLQEASASLDFQVVRT